MLEFNYLIMVNTYCLKFKPFGSASHIVIGTLDVQILVSDDTKNVQLFRCLW